MRRQQRAGSRHLHAVWAGVRFADVLERAGVTARAVRGVVSIGADNYTDSIPLDRALYPGTDPRR